MRLLILELAGISALKPNLNGSIRHLEINFGMVRQVKARAENLPRLHRNGCVFPNHVSASASTASTWDGETVVIQKNRTRKANSL
jgi:hypothetical protein